MAEFFKPFKIVDRNVDKNSACAISGGREYELYFNSTQRIPDVNEEVELIVSHVAILGAPPPYTVLSVKGYYER